MNTDNYCIILEDKIYSQRTPNSKFTEFTLKGVKVKSYEELPEEIKTIIDVNENLQQNPSKYLEYSIKNNEVQINKIKTSIVPYIKIPDTIEECPVIKLGPRITNYDLLDITQIQLPDTIREFSEATFQSSKIKYINTPKNLKTIPKKCFFDSHIIQFDFSNIEYIDEHAFESCAELKKADLSNVKKIERGIFSSCHKLEEVKLPERLTKIPEFTFYECISLKKANIPLDATSIEKFAFYDTAINKINFNAVVEYIGISAFSHCRQLTELTMPNNLIKIDRRAFAGCGRLSNVILNSELKEIKSEAFEKTNVRKIIMPENTSYYSDAFPIDTKIFLINERDEERY